jgi:hypothetical protein
MSVLRTYVGRKPKQVLQKPFLLALQTLWPLVSLQFPNLFTIGRTPWTTDQLIARPLPKHRRAQTQKNTYTQQISMT